MKVNPWITEALQERGIKVNSNGTIEVAFTKGKFQKVEDLNTAIRQQKHIIDQQKCEQKENEELGVEVNKFNQTLETLKDMSMEEFTEKRKKSVLKNLTEKLEILGRKKNELRVQALQKLQNIYKMLEANNIPAAVWAGDAFLTRLRKRWLVNEKVIDKSLARLAALENLKGSK